MKNKLTKAVVFMALIAVAFTAQAASKKKVTTKPAKPIVEAACMDTMDHGPCAPAVQTCFYKDKTVTKTSRYDAKLKHCVITEEVTVKGKPTK